MSSATLYPRRLVCGALAVALCLSSLGLVPALAQRRRLPAQTPTARGRKGVAPKAKTKAVVPARWRAALERITADDMRGHLAFLSSDLLEGRKTPSRGLDIAAEYIAAQFRRVGLEPAGDDGYFQTASWEEIAASSRRMRSLPPEAGTMKFRNVAGILRGSDPVLKDTYVIVSGHYDHVGMKPEGETGDRIYNGANDDGSGTVGVVEIAQALAKLNPRPKRSILFITFFGEELGLVGSRFYGRHPVVPLARTVAQVNMEQVGRTDDSEGPQVARAAVTGFDFSEVGATLRRAGEAVGVEVYKHPKNSDAYFGRSDNQSLADAGIPAHTLGVTFEFPDYHGVGDEWQKIDFANMERVVRAVALGVLLIADNPRAPRWNEQNPKTAQYVEAWKKLHGR
ncbi:MAG TPA: M28 family peptidase [Pyrinomonadaceae bacterium]|nr:M28 family peptidase [Pyrinomonadaceae bacterium]